MKLSEEIINECKESFLSIDEIKENLAMYYKPKIEQLEKENEQLKADKEKMKCCGNCKHSSCICDGVCYKLSNWELKE